MSKLIATTVAALFAIATTGVFAAQHTGAAPMKAAAPHVSCKDPKNKEHPACKPAGKKTADVKKGDTKK